MRGFFVLNDRMSIIFQCLFFIITCSLPLASKAMIPENEIRHVLSSLARSMNEKDLEAVMNAWSNQGEKFTLEGGIFRGETELRKYHLGLFNNSFRNARYEYIPQAIRMIDSKNAIVDGVWRTFEAGPESYPSCGLFLFHMIKVDLTWKLKLSLPSVPRLGWKSDHGRNLSWVNACSRPSWQEGLIRRGR